MCGLSSKFNVFIDTKKYSNDSVKDNEIKQTLKTALSDDKLTGEEIENLKTKFGDDTDGFNSALENIISTKGSEEYKKHESSPSDISFNLSADVNGIENQVSITLETSTDSSNIGTVDIGATPNADSTEIIEQTPTEEEYNQVNQTLKESNDQITGGSIETNKRNSVSYIKYPKNSENCLKAKELQQNIGVKADGFIGPQTLTTLIKKYDFLIAKGDRNGLSQLNSLIDSLGLRESFKSKILGTSLDEIYNKTQGQPTQKPVVQQQVQQPTQKPVVQQQVQTPTIDVNQDVRQNVQRISSALNTGSTKDLSEALTTHFIALPEDKQKELIMGLFSQRAFTDETSVNRLVNRLSNMYTNANNMDKNILKIAMEQINTVANDLKDNPNVLVACRNAKAFTNKITSKPEMITATKPNPTNFGKEQFIKGVEESLNDPKPDKLLSYTVKFLDLNSETLKSITGEVKTDLPRLYKLHSKIEEWKKNADPLTKLRLDKIVSSIQAYL